MSETETQDAVNTELIGAGAAVTSAVALGYVCILLFESPVLAGAVAVLSAAGSYLMLPYFMRVEEPEEGDGGATGGNFHPGAAGIALSGSAVVAIALMFVFEDPLIAIAGGIGLAAGEYAVTSRVLPHA